MSAPSARASSSVCAWVNAPSSSRRRSSWMIDRWLVEAWAPAAGNAARTAAAATRTRAARRRRVSFIRDIATPHPHGSCGRGLRNRLEALGDLVPVNGVPPCLEVVGALVLVLQVVGVLPHVDAQQRR